MKEFSPLDRHEYIFHKILKKESLLSNEIAKYLKVSRKTIERDLKESISSIFERPIIYEKGEWKVSSEPIIDIGFYSASELAVISLLFKFITNDNPKLSKNTVMLFNKLHEKASHSIYKQSSIEDILSTHKNQFYLIKSAIESNREIKFEFNENEKHVQPLKIVNLEKYWYLFCFDLLEKKFKKYYIKSIKDIKILDNIFYIDTYSYIGKLNNAINAFFNVDNEINVKLQLDFEAKKVLSRIKLNSTQKIIKDDVTDKYILTIKVTHFMEIIPTIQQWIPYIKVIYPNELKEKLKENLKNYKIE
ncbi:conserved hypothetical protein (WYL domain) [Aliarcobacter butzleri 7h1h]|uniref:Transcriptional regulator n=1 Tax=Aliarcobacter butzleri L352 TaxID=1447260 RepID=A0A837JEF4_9BACT|nr:WYL domain-containing transcriptional regulator [Aliarcobacter butzleri]AGR77458.1 conserved hypothetical protein (WYL domain) [Aliarcobacter butzleri 7h1h]KLE06494.1 hypothetical protein AF77_01605 [Aliarcobacter butzleri L352]MDN5092196.1 WYL domain-containing transcriptional regulator [Aliarcobacter butzleri]